MNREIRFRGKRCSDGKWVYGFYIESKYSWKGHKPHKSWIVSNAISNGGFFNILGRYAVKDNTVGQFTGLYDKNGKEIYEGDIVKCNEFVYSVMFNDKRFASFGLRRKADVFMHYFGEAMESQQCEVIGNIHDNPELLK